MKFHIDFERDLGSLGARLGTPLAPIWEPCGVLGGALALKLDARRGQKLNKNRILAPRSLQHIWDLIFDDLGISPTSLGTFLGMILRNVR